MAGGTGSGKSTVADHLSGYGGLRRLAASSVLLEKVGARAGKRERLLSWLADPAAAAARRCADVTAERVADLATLSMCRAQGGDVVVETAGPVALLQPTDTSALLMLVDAAAPVRAARIRRVLGGVVTPLEASRIVAAKDSATVAAVRAAWALDLSEIAALVWRFDVVIGCPDPVACQRPVQCRLAVRELATAAVSLYGSYLGPGRGDGSARHLAAVAERWQQWLIRLCPALRDPPVSPTADRWRSRLVDELSRRAGKSSNRGESGLW